jgi:hypothetical protein
MFSFPAVTIAWVMDLAMDCLPYTGSRRSNMDWQYQLSCILP